jgi:hypothetical protein
MVGRPYKRRWTTPSTSVLIPVATCILRMSITTGSVGFPRRASSKRWQATVCPDIRAMAARPRRPQLDYPWGVFVDPFTGNLLIADSNNHRVREVDSAGRISSRAGWGELGYGGDGGDAHLARLDSPQSLGFDCAGRMYIGDEHNHVIRVVDLDGTIRTLVGTGAPGLARDGSAGIDAAPQRSGEHGGTLRRHGIPDRRGKRSGAVGGAGWHCATRSRKATLARQMNCVMRRQR